MDDSTFRAYRNNPRFLSSILPLSAELDFILSRIFEHDPRRRINIPELRDLILRCNNLTTRSTGALPPTPPSEPQYVPGREPTCHTYAESVRDFDHYVSSGRAAVSPSLAAYPIMAQCSTSSGGSDHGSIFSAASSCSSTSSCGSYESASKVPEPITYTAPQQRGSLFNCSFAFSGPLLFQQQSCMPSIAAN